MLLDFSQMLGVESIFNEIQRFEIILNLDDFNV